MADLEKITPKETNISDLLTSFSFSLLLPLLPLSCRILSCSMLCKISVATTIVTSNVVYSNNKNDGVHLVA